jgi:hypothetical protein
MQWFTATHIDAWSQRIDARTDLSLLISQLVRASVASMSDYEFPTGDSAQRPGYDGRLTAHPAPGFEHYLPDGNSVWEFGATEHILEKINSDYAVRTENPGCGVDPTQTTLVFIAGRRWRHQTTIVDWIAEKKKTSPWKDIKVFDAAALETWLELCPGVAASIARDVVGTLPRTGALCPQEFWDEYAGRFQPHLTEAVAVAGRSEQSSAILRQLTDSPQVFRWQGDSLLEVIAFMAASIRSAPEADRKFLESRVLIVETEEAARLLKGLPQLIFAVHREAMTLAGSLSDHHVVILPLGRDSLRDAAATRLARPTSYEMAEAFKSMGLNEDDARRRALECDRSVTILARRISSGVAALPRWHAQAPLIPAFLAGAWDTASKKDQAVIAKLAGVDEYAEYEATVRRYRLMEDAPLETVDKVWAVRAPVDVFVNLANLLGTEHFVTLGEVVNDVFGEIDPTLNMAVEDRPFARIRGENIPPHSPWLREGLANTLLIIAALGPQSDLSMPEGVGPQQFVNSLVDAIPSLKANHRVLASLRHELPLLMEAAPDPLLRALEHLLEGGGTSLKPIFQDDKDKSSIFSSSAHTGLLWALELIAWDPKYLLRASHVLLKLAAIDPGGALANRPPRSLRNIFLPWKPSTNATLNQRLAVLDSLAKADEKRSWDLLVALLPKGHDVAEIGLKPKFREAGESEKEVITYQLLYKAYDEIIARVLTLAGSNVERWADVLDTVHTFSDPQKTLAIDAFGKQIDKFSGEPKAQLWEKLAKVIRHHRAWPQAGWSLGDDFLKPLEQLLKQLEPNDPIQQTLWLFEESFPLIEHREGKDFLGEAERLRNEAIKDLIDKRGTEALFQLAERAKAPRFIGLAAGQIVDDSTGVMRIALEAFDRGPSLNGFVSLLSAAANVRFGDEWVNRIRATYKEEKLTPEQIVIFALGWNHERRTWDFVAEFGKNSDREYWRQQSAWGLKGSTADITYAVERYLGANRAEIVILELFPQFGEIGSRQLLETLDQFDERIRDEPKLLQAGNLNFYLQQVFGALRQRDDVAREELALREYRYLSLLRWGRVYGNEGTPLELEKFMSESPEFYVRILSDVFAPTSERGKQREVSEQERARAHVGWTLLEGFAVLPGQDGDQIDQETLEAWVSRVLALAAESDRLTIAEQKVGALLAHSPTDTRDGIWPHITVRKSLETWSSDSIEHGMLIERMNMRGVTRRLPKDGGKQEWDIASAIRTDSKTLREWPRTSSFLRTLAEYWEESAKREDIHAQQLELRE